MRDHAAEALALLAGLDRQGFDTDRVRQLAVVRLLEIVGEAAARTPPDVIAHYPDIEWGQIVALRNRLIHGYDAVDLDIVWAIVTTDLPLLVSRLEQILGPDDSAAHS